MAMRSALVASMPPRSVIVGLVMLAVPCLPATRVHAQSSGAAVSVPPRRPALSYMLSRRQVLYRQGDAAGSRLVGAWPPHLMTSFPGLTNAGIGHVPGSDGPIIANEGTATSHFVIAVRDWSRARAPIAP
ncbi:MAG TPA: hypothetical protein VFY16_10270 [Gemmatimonadaceae bacterium]|nr:hypothetical protein [Gemmatimonadaceae bacterium]